MSRPQEEGDKERWHYEYFEFYWIQESHHYINHAHCWTDLKLERGEYPMLFAQLIEQNCHAWSESKIMLYGLPG